ncbi:MAG: protein kinase [Polyangiales bacterium]
MSEQASEQGERFELRDPLGTGATGTVFRAFDRARHAVVALKVLTQVDPSSLYRFKAEFRALSGLSHPNLVQLHDLVTQTGRWMLSMELVDGPDFLRWVRPRDPAMVRSADGSPSSDQLAGADGQADEATVGLEELAGPSQPPPPPANDNDPTRARPSQGGRHGLLDLVRLRAALPQLCEGLRALHRADRLHRDLKPANVLVHARDGRLVICDFGLVTDGTRVETAGNADTGLAGTLAYMAPEQARGEMVTEASDWYAVGVMLYQALTGVLPFPTGLSPRETIAKKRAGQVVHPSALASEAPEDLGDLAVALLAGDPAQRPTYSDIVARLDLERGQASIAPRAPRQLIGRSKELSRLLDALRRARAGLGTAVLVSGHAGMGTSALLRHFIELAREREQAVVLTGRCYEREQLPYKAFDPLLDALSSHLVQQPEALVSALLPPHVGALGRLFPVLRRVPAITRAMAAELEEVAPFEEKRRAFTAFRELCRNMAEKQPLVLLIDDLQWGDLDSGRLLAELLHLPRPPAVLFVGAHRLEGAEHSPLLTALRTTLLTEAGARPVELEVGPLSANESRALALHVLGELVVDAEHVAERIASQAGGSPLLVTELALHARRSRSERAPASDGAQTFEALIDARLARLPPDARRLFDLVATAGRPERRELLAAASGLGDGFLRAVRTLETHKLVLASGSDDRIEPYHEQLREAAYRGLEEGARRRLHGALAEALELCGEGDSEALFEHVRESDTPERAGLFALGAAQNAESQLAYERAARLYGEALARHESAGLPPAELQERRAHCFMLAGYRVEAADAYLEALDDAPPERQLALRSLATTQLLRAGRVRQAFAQLVLAGPALGLRAPETTGQALRMWLWRSIKLRFARMWLGRRRAAEQSALLQRADFLWDIGSTLVAMDGLRGAVYQAEHLLVAMAARDPYRLARALAVEAALTASRNRDPARTQRLIDRGLTLAGCSGEPSAIAAVKGTAGVCRLLEGRFREAVRLTDEAITSARTRPASVQTWDYVQLLTFQLQACAQLGDVRRIVEVVPVTLRDAEARGDVFAATSCRTRRCVWAWLAPDHPDQARQQLEVAESQWTQEGYQLQNWYITQARAEVDLYCDTPGPSLARLAAERPRQRFLRRIQYARVELAYLHARLCLASARQQDDEALRVQAADDARAIAREDTAWSNALAKLLRACLASFGDEAIALQLLQEAEGQFDALDMALHREVARYRRGQLLMEGEGARMLDRADAAIRALGIERPAAFVALLAPGFPSVDARPQLPSGAS